MASPRTFATKDDLLDLLDEQLRLPQSKEDCSELGLRRRRRELLVLVARAQELGLYPLDTVADNPSSVVDMVETYGARWFRYEEPLACPRCSSDLRDRVVGPPFKREVAVYDRSSDRTVAYLCPDCGGRWER